MEVWGRGGCKVEVWGRRGSKVEGAGGDGRKRYQRISWYHSGGQLMQPPESCTHLTCCCSMCIWPAWLCHCA